MNRCRMPPTQASKATVTINGSRARNPDSRILSCVRNSFMKVSIHEAAVRRFARKRSSESLVNEPPSADRRHVVVGAVLVPLGKVDPLVFHRLVRDQAQEVPDAIQPGPALVV